MKKGFMILAAAVGVAIAGNAGAQIPVTDVAMNAQTITNQAANIAKYIQMIQQYKVQIDQMKQQYDSLTGIRNFGDILNNPTFKDYLPTEWQSVYDKVKNGGYQGLTGSAQAIRDANKLFDTCAGKTGSEKQVCERAASKAAMDKAFATDAFDKAKSRLEQIEGLMRKINTTTDPKAIAELQGRISAEQAAIQNEQTKLQMYQMIAQAEDRLIEQQQRESAASHFGNSQYASPESF
jgi:type IV secretion system protein VirB5